MTAARFLSPFLLLLTCQCAARSASQRQYHAGDQRSEIGTEGFDTLMKAKVRRAAAFDFRCAREEIRIVKLDQGAYGAIGCDRRARYVGRDEICFDGNTQQRLVVDCVVIMSGPLQDLSAD